MPFTLGSKARHIRPGVMVNYVKQLYRFLNPKFQNIFIDYPVQQRPRYGHGRPYHDRLDSIIESYEEQYISSLRSIVKYQDDLELLSDRIPEALGFRWRNEYFPGLDTAMLYVMVAEQAPKKYVEIGSGVSTIVAAQASQDHELKTKFVSIDPQPRKEIAHLVDRSIQDRLEDIDMSLFDELDDGDILFVDNSHRILPNSDSMVFYMEILPRLRSGVVVHIHDIYLPADYPQFMCDRFYSEQYGLAIALMNNPQRYKILAPNFYISETPHLAKQIESLWDHPSMINVERHGGSFWFRIN